MKNFSSRWREAATLGAEYPVGVVWQIGLEMGGKVKRTKQESVNLSRVLEKNNAHSFSRVSKFMSIGAVGSLAPILHNLLYFFKFANS